MSNVVDLAEIDKEVARLATLSDVMYDREREASAKRLGTTLRTLNKKVAEEKRKTAVLVREARAGDVETPEHFLAWEWTGEEHDQLRAKSYANTYNGLLQLEVKFQHDVFHDKKQVDGKELGDDVCRELRERLLRHQGVDPGADNVRQAAERLCEINAFDPIVDYLAAVEPTWDGKPRLDSWLENYMGAEDREFYRAVSKNVLIAAVRRTRHPGTKYDEIVVFEGPEGRGKSEAILILAGGKENFSDQKILGAKERDVQELLRGNWFYEIAELGGMRKAETDEVKAFASRTNDRARPAYGHFVIQQPRRCVFIATTNSNQYLKSQTGNRRFWPVVTGKIDLDGLRRDRNQLFAEAAQREAKGESIRLEERLWQIARNEQGARLVSDTWEQSLENFYGTVIGNEERIFIRTVLAYLQLTPDRQAEGTSGRLRACMERLGWEHRATAIRIGNEVGKGFVRAARDEARSRQPSVFQGEGPPGRSLRR